jgi:hypothetical protein
MKEAAMAVETANGKSNAIILEKDGKYFVRPAYASVDGEKLQFRIRNMSETEDAVVTLPASRVAAGEDHRGKIQPGQDFVTTLARQNGKFSYKVKVDGVRAEGESDPVIIIDPPAN